ELAVLDFYRRWDSFIALASWRRRWLAEPIEQLLLIERLQEMHPCPETHGPVGRFRRFGAPPRSLLESCRVTSAPGRPGQYYARRLPRGGLYAQQARAPASGSRRVRRHNQRNAARAQFWLGAEFVALQLERIFSLLGPRETCIRAYKSEFTELQQQLERTAVGFGELKVEQAEIRGLRSGAYRAGDPLAGVVTGLPAPLSII